MNVKMILKATKIKNTLKQKIAVAEKSVEKTYKTLVEKN